MDDALAAQLFEPGDVFVGCTQIRDPEVDDHAGDGRIIHYDADLNQKAVLAVQGTTHLVTGLEFAPDGSLWACDAWSYEVVRFSPDGRQQPNRVFAQRGFAHVVFPGDETVYLCENFVGEQRPSAINTVVPVLPGEHAKIGDGNLWHFRQDGELLEVLETETHGGVRGFIGLSHAELAADGHTLIYISETGPRIMRYDLEKKAQLTDLASYDPADYRRCFDMALDGDGNVVICMGKTIEVLGPEGELLDTVVPPGDFGWSVICADRDPRFMYVGNWFTGELIRLDMQTGGVLASAFIEPKCVGGIAVCGARYHC